MIAPSKGEYALALALGVLVFCGTRLADAEVPTLNQASQAKTASQSNLEERIAALEAQVAALQAILRKEGNDVRLSAPGDLVIEAGKSARLRARDSARLKATSVELSASRTLELKSAAKAEVRSQKLSLRGRVMTEVKGGKVRLNGGRKPVSRMNDSVQVLCAPVVGGPCSARLITGSPTVYVP